MRARRFRRLGPALCVACACVAAGSTHAGQQRDVDTDTPPESTPTLLATVMVTGTHIRSIDLETGHPIFTLKREDMLRTGLTDVADILQAIVIEGQARNRNVNNGNDGRQLVNLRSLGSGRTLVLVNGQRWVSGLDGAVDLSAIPMSLVQRVEVLKDGASAIYGSDAIAGVINIITRDDFRGAEVGANFAVTEHGDGARQGVDFAWGRRGDRWGLAFGLERAHDDAIMAGARMMSSVPVAGLPLGATGAPYLMMRYQTGPITLIAGRPGTSPDDYRAFDFASDFSFNYAPYNYLQTPIDRDALFAQGHYDVSPTLRISADTLYNRRRSAQQLAPPRVVFGSFCCGGSTADFDLSPDSIFNPFGTPIDALQRRLLEDRPRYWEQTVGTSRLHVAIDGIFEWAGRDIAWGLDAASTRAVQQEAVSPFQDNSRLALAVGPSFRDADGVAHCGTPTAPVAGCVPIELTGPPGTLTRQMLDYVDVSATNRIRTHDLNYSLHASTDLFDLPAGAVNAAAGVEYRMESGTDDPDPLLANGLANGGGINYRPTAGSYSVREAYVEFEIPLLSNRPMARELGLKLATRWSDYSLFGHTNNSQFALRWKPSDDLLLRATYAEGFRAPSTLDLFQGAAVTGEPFIDPCASDQYHHPAPETLARCTAQGVPPDVEAFGGSGVTIGGNPDLRPETARTRTLGFLYSPAALAGLTVGMDWYRIMIRGAIGQRSAQAIMNACYVLGDSVACTKITRSPGEGWVLNVDATQQNIPGGLQTEGYDLSVAWRSETRLGRLDLRWDSAYVGYHGALGKPPAGTRLADGSRLSGNAAGHNDWPEGYYGVIWRLRSVASLAWQRNDWNALIAARYFPSVIESCAKVAEIAGVVGDPSLLKLCSEPNRVLEGVPAPRNRVGAVAYVDLQLGWTAPWKGSVMLGVRNAFDRAPPRAYSAFANSTFPDYDIPGRFLYAGYRQKF